jgi:hypothetical protein
MESTFKCDWDALNEADRTQAFADWKQGKVTKTINNREIMALPRNQALAIAGRDLEYGRGSQTYLTWKTHGITFETLGFSFSKTWELGCDGHWRIYDSFRKHPDYPWLVENREAVNSLGLFKIRGNEPTDKEIKDMIIATGLPVKFEQVDKDDFTEVSNPDDGAVSQSRGTDSYIKSKSSSPKNGTPQKRDRVRVLTIDQTTTITPPKPTDTVARRVFDGIMAILAMLVGARLLDDGRLEVNKDATFKLDDLRQGDWYDWVLANKTLINKAKLGAQIKGDAPSDEALRRWLRKLGFKLVSKRVDVGAKSIERVEIVRGFIEKESDFFRGAMARRLRAGTHFNEKAQKWRDKKAQEIEEYGAPLIPDRPVSLTAARLTIRHRMRRAMYITSDGHGGYKCEPDAPYRLESIVEDLNDFVNRHKSAINKANLGAKVGANGLTVKTLSLWIKAMGIDSQKRRMPLSKYLILKGHNDANPVGAGVLPLLVSQVREAVKPNKDAGGENCIQQNQVVTVYSVKPKCLQKVREIMDNDKCEYMAEYYETIQNAAESTPIEPQDRPLKQRLGDFADEHRDEIFSLTHIAKTFGVEVDEVREAIRDMYDFKAIDHSQVRVLPKLIWSKLPDEPDDSWLRDDDDGIGGSLH